MYIYVVEHNTKDDHFKLLSKTDSRGIVKYVSTDDPDYIIRQIKNKLQEKGISEDEGYFKINYNKLIKIIQIENEDLKKIKRYKNDLRTYFKKDTEVRHCIGKKCSNKFYGIYKYNDNKIIELDNDGEETNRQYDSLNMFAVAHIKRDRPDRKTHNVNAWDKSEFKVDGVWVSYLNRRNELNT